MPRGISEILFVPPWLRSETSYQWPSPLPTRAAHPSPVDRSFLKRDLGLGILLRMHRTRLQARHMNLTQPFADGLPANPHRPTPGDLLTQINQAPAHDPMQFRLGLLDHNARQFFHLSRAQQLRGTTATPRTQVDETCCIVAKHASWVNQIEICVTATRECPLSAQPECPLLARGLDECWGTLDEWQGT